MMRAASILALAALPVMSQEYPEDHTCDLLKIEDDGPHIAVLTYRNSENFCSTDQDRTMRSENGIEVRVIVKVADAETLEVLPLDPQYHATPPRIDVQDGETIQVFVMAGTS